MIITCKMAEESGDPGSSSAASSQPVAQPSLSMRILVYGFRKKFPQVNHITCEETEKMQREVDKKSLLILDTRAEEEFRVGHIPGAVRVDHEDENLHNSLDLRGIKHVLCYCSIGYRSSIAADRLRRQGDGTMSVHNLEGGIFQWAIEQRPMQDNDGSRSVTVHPYNGFWGRLLPDNLRHSNL